MLHAAAQPDTLIIRRGFTEGSVNPWLKVWSDSLRQLQYRQLVDGRQPMFYRIGYNAGFGYAPHPYWLRLAVRNEQASDSFLLSIPYPFIDSLELYECRGSQLTAFRSRQQLWHRANGRQEAILGHSFHLARGETVVLLVKAGSHKSLKVPMRLATHQAYARQAETRTGLYAFFTGVMALALVFAFFLFFILREPAYCFYGGYIICLWLVMTFTAGLLAPAFIHTDIRQIVALAGVGLLLLFTRSFLQVKQYGVRLHRWYNRLFFYIAGCAVLFLALQLGWLSLAVKPVLLVLALLFNVLLLFAVILVAAAIVNAFRNRYLPAWFYLVAITPFLLCTVFVVLVNYSVLAYTGPVNYWYLSASLFQVSVLSLGMAYRFKRYKDSKEQILTEYNSIQQELVRSLVKGQHMERRRLSQELHDGLGQRLCVIHMQLETLKATRKQDGSLDILGNYVQDSIHELRQIATNMMPPLLSTAGLGIALREMIETIDGLENISINFHCDTALEQMENKQKEVAIFRIVQEALTNTVKHAGASAITIRLIGTPQDIGLRIEDNGKGFDATTLKTGNGLRNIKARIKELGGTIEITGTPGKGTRLIATIR